MANLWVLDSPTRHTTGEDDRTWSRRPLAAVTPLGAALVVRASTPGSTHWVIVGPPSVRVNGIALDAGCAVLRDQDELCVAGQRLFLSTEVLAVIVPFPGSDRPVRCARCKTALTAESPAIACPRCGIWSHQSEALGCWTYAPTCSACDQPTALDTGYRFVPEVL